MQLPEVLCQISVQSSWRRPWKLIVCISSVESVACFFLITISSLTKWTRFSGNLWLAFFNGPDTNLLLVCGSIYPLRPLWMILWTHEVCAPVVYWLVDILSLLSLFRLLGCWHAAWIQSSFEPNTWSSHKEGSFLHLKAFQLESLLFYRIPNLLRSLFIRRIQK